MGGITRWWIDVLPGHSLQGAASAVRTSALQMLEEHDRGVVLVSDARVDATLARLLQAMLLPSSDRSDYLFQADRPLGSFGARINLAHRLGLIERPVELALDTLRRVPNAFAPFCGMPESVRDNQQGSSPGRTR